MKNKIKIVVVQYKTIYLNLKANLKKFRRLLKKCSDNKPDLVIFPEYALTGPLYGHYNLSFQPDNEIYHQLSFLAKKYGIHLIPGSFVRKINGLKHNSSCIISPQGKYLGFYNKQCLWSSEKQYLKKSTQTKIFKTSLGKIAVQICADLHSSLISHSYRELKPDIIINLAMWTHEDNNDCLKTVPYNIQQLQVEHLSRSRALENRAFFIFCNFGGQFVIKLKNGKEYPETSIGQTMIVNPYGEIVSKVNTNKEEIIFSEIDLSKCHWSKNNY